MAEQMRISEPPVASGGRDSPDGMAVMLGWEGHARRSHAPAAKPIPLRMLRRA
ncbi:hypothetical protein ACFQU2_16160 [Siccirubricoccus deserti]